MGRDSQEYKQVNNTLVSLFKEIMKLEENAIITEEFKDLTNNDMHVIEAIGIGDGHNMSTIAKKLGITVGSLTISINALVKKGYVDRSRSEQDRRVVNVCLTESGVKAFRHHEEYHHSMTEAVLNAVEGEEKQVLMKLLSALTDFFNGYTADNK